MPYRFKSKPRRKYTKPRRKYRKKTTTTKKNYPNTRASALQRMDLVPNSKILKCVFDETYLVKGNGLSKDNTLGLCFNLNDLFNGIASTQDFTTPKSPYWGSAVGTNSLNMSGNSNQIKPPGFDRYISDGTSFNEAPYLAYTVLGGKWSFRVEMVHQIDGAGTPANELVKLIAVATRLGRDVTNQLQTTTELTDWQGSRGIKQSNLTGLVSTGSNRPSSSSNQQCRMSGTWSAKKFFQIADIKDNQDRIGGSFNEEGTYIPPPENCYLQLGIFDRLQRGDDLAIIFPNFNIRFRYEAVVLCNTTNQNRNLQP